ncbi:hypothetical protein CGRA01v4_10536 [Colletotrichum graminicola]|nr:hypothetical protein CGRA01v4_10536 [Colletotrichum graminicola]
MSHVDHIFTLGLPYRKGSTNKLREKKKRPDFLFTFCRPVPPKEGVVFFFFFFFLMFYYFFVISAWSWVWKDDGETVSVLRDAQRCIQGVTGYRDGGLAGVCLFSGTLVAFDSTMHASCAQASRKGYLTVFLSIVGRYHVSLWIAFETWIFSKWLSNSRNKGTWFFSSRTKEGEDV